MHATTSHRHTSKFLAGALALLWAGALLGVSFIATPVKFWAHSLTLPVALDVGRQTFQFFTKLELGTLALLTALVFASQRDWMPRALMALLAALLALQLVWLLPALDQRVELVLHNQLPAPSHVHQVYIACDAWKFVLLLALYWTTSKPLK